MFEKDISANTTLFSILSDDTRLHIIEELLTWQSRCNTNLAEDLGISTANLSNHLRLMRMNNLVDVERKGKQTFYSLKTPKELSALLDSAAVFLKATRA